MAIFTATVASDERHTLAEGPVWFESAEQILWVDVVKGQVFEGRLNGDRIEQTRHHDFDGMVGAVVKAENGDLLVAEQEQLVLLSPSGERTVGPRIVPEGKRGRTNDGACDPAGRFLVGTLALDDRIGEETLLRIEDNGELTTIDNDLSLSNGLAWSPDGRQFYSTDTVSGVIRIRDYNPTTGEIGPWNEHLRITDGFPDGICVDARGNLWVAIWGSGEIRSFSPDGRHVDTVRLPCPHPSSVAFIGSTLDILLITTASRDLTEKELRAYPDAGRLFIARVGTSGTPCSPWSGSWISATPAH